MAEITLIEGIIAIYLIAGSYTLGYFLLRTGWPGTRLLEERYKIGWSIAIGTLFSALSVGGAYAVFTPTGIGFAPGATLMLTAAFALAAIVLTARRRFIHTAPTRVVAPKEKIVSATVAQKTMQKMDREQDLILSQNIDAQKVARIRETLLRKKEREGAK